MKSNVDVEQPSHDHPDGSAAERVGHSPCPRWCAPAECDGRLGSLHRFGPPRAHRGPLLSTWVGLDDVEVEVHTQLVRFFDDPEGPDFVRLLFGDQDGRQSFYLRTDQAAALTTRLSELCAITGDGPESPSPPANKRAP